MIAGPSISSFLTRHQPQGPGADTDRPSSLDQQHEYDTSAYPTSSNRSSGFSRFLPTSRSVAASQRPESLETILPWTKAIVETDLVGHTRHLPPTDCRGDSSAARTLLSISQSPTARPDTLQRTQLWSSYCATRRRQRNRQAKSACIFGVALFSHHAPSNTQSRRRVVCLMQPGFCLTCSSASKTSIGRKKQRRAS